MGNIRNLNHDNEQGTPEKLDFWMNDLKQNADAIDLLLSEDLKIPELKGYNDFDAHAALGKLSFMQEDDIIDIEGYKDYDPPKAYKKVETKLFEGEAQTAKTFSLRPLMRIAAAAVVLLVATMGVYNFMGGSANLTSEIATARQAYNLPDGSVITLDQGSELAYDTGNFGDNRVVEFDGRAYFDIAKQSGQNFIIKADDLEVEVLGTQFEINVIGDKKEVRVYEGKVRVTQNGKETILVAGEAVTGMTKQKINTTLPSWYTGKLDFQGLTVKESVPLIEDHYKVNISFAKSTFDGPCDFPTEFKNKPLETILDEIKLLYGGSYTINDDQVTYTGLACRK